ncbi:neprilysin-2-like [Microplitis demolitor]|uniref:neprilysin-2-like n=1 Tax=Microplitis demolitor TaxID=69319 RepID=UPI00235B5EBD|nr:neprilysin-2-like [Microplitis demolitor]
MNTTSKRTQSNFIIWRVIFDSVSFLSEEINKKRIDFLSSANGNTKRQPRSNECLNAISHYLPLAIGSLYIKKYFNEDAKNNVTEMVNAIINQFKKTLETVDWMDEVTRKHALKKADSMVTDIAYNDGLLDEKKIETIYENFEFDINDSYLQTILNLGSYMNEINREKFRTHFNKSDWVLYLNPTAVNAFNLFHYNIIQFPAAILQGSFFNNDRPRYINYGAVGFLIGHEITHGFDTIGKRFYEDGNLLKWWEASTDDKFWDKALCFYEQYQNYVVNEVGMNVNGLKTITENIADNGGLKTTYLAYKSWAESQNVSEPRLPGLDHYTPTQMFWISASHTWCTAQRPEVLKIQIISDNHSPAEFRVIGAFSNIKEFSDDFKCPVGSPMNPRSKCSMW